MKKKRQPGKLIRLTKDERVMLKRAITISAEDGSIYGGAVAPSEYEPINAAMEVLQKKLR